MKRRAHITAFYMETLLLILVFISIILVLIRVFALGRSQSAAAADLNTAVCLAQNAAEAVAASDSPEAVAALLNEANNARVIDGRVEVGYDRDMSPNSTRAPSFWVYIQWTPEGDGRLVRSEISVLRGDPWDAEPVYSLQTAVYLPEVRG